MYKNRTMSAQVSTTCAVVAAVALLALSGCGDGTHEPTKDTARPLPIVVTLSPALAAVHVTDTVTLTVSVTGVSGTPSWEWSVSDSAVLRVVSPGKVVALRAGSSLVHAQAGSLHGIAQVSVGQ